MGLFSKIKSWFKRTFSGGGSSSSSRASRVSNYGGGGSRSYRDYSGGGYEHEYQSYQRRRELERQERKKKQQATTNALASISKRTDSLSSGRSSSVASSATSTGNGTTRVLERISEKSKATPPDPKQKAKESSQVRATRLLKSIDNKAKGAERTLNNLDKKVVAKAKSERDSFNKATGNKYNTNTGDKAHDAKARQRIKSGEYQSDPNAEKWEVKNHPIAASAARGALSGVTFGGSELVAQKSKNRQKSGAEKFYQQNKNRKAEVAGEIAGSLVGFGLTGEASAKAVGKLTPKAVKSLGARGTEKLASSAMIRRAAEKEAVKRFGVEGATKEVINQIARRRATTAMAELGKDAAINATTGLASDLSHSYLDASKNGTFDRGEFAKSMGQNAALNTLLGGATSLVPAFRVGKHFDDGIDALKSVNASNVADDVKVSLNRRRRTDVRMPEVRPQTTENVADQSMRDASRAISDSNQVLGQNMAVPARDSITRGEASYGGIQIKYTPKEHSEASSWGSEIHVSDKFFEQPEDIQRHILNHEVAHNWSDELMGEHSGDWQDFASIFVKEKDVPPSSTAYANGQRTYWEGLYGDIGATSLSETTTRAITEYLDNPDALMRRSPEAYEVIRNFVERRTGQSIGDVRPRSLDEAIERAATDTVEQNADEATRVADTVVNTPAEAAVRGEPQAPKKPSEIMAGYKSNGYKKRIADANKRVKAMLANGDTSGARAEIERAVDDIVRNTRIEEPLEDNIVEIKEILRNTPISTSSRYKVDAGYLSGGYNEFRKGNFGSLKLTNDGTPIDDLWLRLQETYGTSLFPDEIDVPSEQLQYLSDLAKTKGRDLELPDEEIAALREQLSESLWESANKGRDHAPFSMRDEDWQTLQAASRPVSDEELAAIEKRAIEDGLIDERVSAPRSNASEEPSQFAQVDESMEGINSDAERQAQRNISQSEGEAIATKIEEDATGRPMTDEEIKTRRETAAKAKKNDKKIKPRKMPKGERLTERVSKKVEGATFEEATKPASAKEIVDAEAKYIRGQASNYENVVSRGGTSLVGASGSEAETKVVKDLLDENAFNYARVKNKEKYEWAVREFVENKDTVAKKMLKYADNIDSIPTTQLVDTHYQAHAVMKMMRSQLDNPDLTQAEREAAREIYGAAASLTQQLSSMSGQINQFQGVMVHCDGKTRMRNAVDNIANLLDASRGFRTSKTGKGLSGNAFQRKNQIRDIIYKDPDARKALEKIVDAGTEEEYGNAMQELLYATSKMNRKHALDYIQTWRYLAMLGNPKTHVRNILGNVTFSGIRNLSNTNRSFIEKGLEGYARQHGLEIERHGTASISAFSEARSKNPTTDAGKAAKEWFEKKADEILSGAKYDENIAKGSDPNMMKWLTWLSDGNGKLLEGEDNFFRKRSYKESFIKSYNQYKRDGKAITEDLLEKIHKSALKESQIATFNEFNSMAQVLSKWSHTNFNDSLGRKAAGWTVNAMMPFTKVPSNILKQSVNYSPIGVLRGISNISAAAKTGDSAVFNRALDELSSGITGTGIAALGFFLGKGTDMFTTNAGSEDAAAKFKKLQGVQNYSMTFKDPTSGETYSVTLDWLVPASATFFAGVEMANQMKRGYGDLFEFVGDMSQVTSRVIEPVLETSMLSGLYNIVEGARNGTGEDEKQNFLSLTLRELTQSYANSLIPTAQGQIARTAYKSDKQLTGETDWEYWINSLKNKMGIANTNLLGTEALGADTTAYGDVKNEKRNAGDYVKSGLKNFLSPANIQRVDLDEVDQAKIAQYEDAVKNGADPQEMSYLFPKKQYKKQFQTGNLDVKMSNKDLSAYNQAKTTGGAEGARYALESIMFNRYTKDANGNKQSTADAYTPEQKAAIIQQFDGKSIRDVEKWVREQPQFKNSTEAEQKKVIDGLWSYSKQGKSVSAKRVGEQAVIKAQGGDVNEYNFNNEISDKKREVLQPLVDSGVISYEQAVDFARYAGKTYYYEDDEGGHSQTYYNKGVMYDYLDKMGYDDETKAALFNAFKAWNAKEYGVRSGKGRKGRRRRGYRRYGRGGSSKKTEVPKPKTIKASSFTQGEALVSKRSSSSAKATPPKLKRVQAKIDLPNKKR